MAQITHVSVTSEPTTADVLRDVRDLLADPARWVKGWYAGTDGEADPDRNLDGTDPRATCFCLRGALQRVLGTWDNGPAYYFLVAALPEGYVGVAGFDHPGTRHIDILDALDRAVSAAVLAETK